MTPHFVAFHTGGNYGRHVAEMQETAEKFGVVTSVWQLPNLGDWCANCSQKSVFVSFVMNLYPGQPIVYIDADARFRQVPTLLLNMPPECDFAAHWLDGNELLSGTLYLSGSVASVELAADWKRRCIAEPNVWDQQHLSAAVTARPTLNVINLPESYTRIFDRPGRCDAVIEHMQASRQAHD